MYYSFDIVQERMTPLHHNTSSGGKISPYNSQLFWLCEDKTMKNTQYTCDRETWCKHKNSPEVQFDSK